MFKKRLLFLLVLGSLLVLVPVRSQNELQENEEMLEKKVDDSNNILSFTLKTINEKMMSFVEVKAITAYEGRDPINILNNSAFGSGGYNFPGSGTSTNPYLIEGYNITDGSSELIHIVNTSVYFEVRDCYFDGLDNTNYANILLDNVTHGTIINNTLTNTYTGILLSSNSTDNLCRDNMINFCSYDGIFVEDSNDNVFLNNTLFECEYAFDLSNSDHTIISGNNISGYYPSVVFSKGIYLNVCNNNSISSNTITNPSEEAIELTVSSNDNNVTENFIFNCTSYGITIGSSSSNNLIYRNFLLNNSKFTGGSQGADNSLSNSWNNGTHGNYWSDYTGPDDVAPYGIGETNYTLDGGLLINDTKPLVSMLNLTGTGTMYYEADAPTNIISWDLTANLIGSYYLYQDTVLSASGNWTTESMIQTYLPSLVLNTVYNYTIVVSDISGNTVNKTVLVTARDTIAPEITYTGSSERSFEFNTTGQTITVTATDMYPDTYVLYQNGTGSTPETWDSGTPITTSLGGLSIGGYNFTLVVKDTSGNQATQTVLVTVSGTTSQNGSFAEIFLVLGSLGTLVVYIRKRR